ncbi:MAG: hypothetical protein AAFX79_03365 [Planctomycetota bacterium]
MEQTLGIWAAASQVELIAALARTLGVRVVAAGAPVRAQGPGVADAFGASYAADLHDLLADDRAGCVLLACLDGEASRSSGLPRAIVRAAAEGRAIATLAPIPLPTADGAEDWYTPADGRVPAEAIRFGPLLRRAPAAQEAAEVLEAFGDVRSALIAGHRGGEAPAAGAQLVDALDVLVAYMGEPERVDAAHLAVGRPTRTGRQAPALDALHGDVTAHYRFADGKAAVVAISDQAGGWSRRATLLGPAGRLDLGDGGHRWVDASGRLVDGTERRDRGDAALAEVDALADFLSPILQGRATPPLDAETLGPLVSATLLSTRTGQAESPATIRAMA